MAAWESGTLRQAGVWEMSTTRSRFQIAAQSLVPVVLLAWAMLIVPVGTALLMEGVWPTWLSLRPLMMGLITIVSHAAIGFAVGRWVPKVVSAPLLAVATWVAVAFTVTVDAPWLRHVSGEFPEQLMFGEAASFAALWPHVAMTGSIALAVALLWTPTRQAWLPPALSLCVLVGGTVGTYTAVKDYGYNPPLLTGETDMSCVHAMNGGPQVCLPQVTASHLPQAAEDTEQVLTSFREARVDRYPKLITDTLPDGRFAKPSNESTWRAPLTLAAQRNDLKFAIVLAAVGLDCSRPDPFLRRVTIAWAAHITHTQDSWKAFQARIDRGTSRSDVDDRLTEVLSLSRQQQADWFNDSVTKACAH
ncbi:hypothetical protein [Streptomyces sp. NPDC048644]|uniref:hypothetical protein n=1 Tax=Streptomyces sp. NPDC048644 TaxID=3365582 RepID=UPI003716E7ED